MRLLTKKEAKEIDIDFIYESKKEGALMIISPNYDLKPNRKSNKIIKKDFI